jgi:hypothetical protein
VIGNSALPGAGYQLDLSSPTANIVLGAGLFNSARPSVTINQGGTTETFSAGSKVTAGQYVAIQEQLGKGTQTIVLNNKGVADGGSFSLNSAAKSGEDEIVVPTGVTAIANTGKKNLSINGDLINYGSIEDITKSSSAQPGAITALDIVNEKGGTISTQSLNSSLTAGASSGVNLTLEAQKGITNSGAISNSGSLTLSTINGGITNTSSGLVKASGDLNLSSGDGSINNAGKLSSSAGNVNINTQNAAGLTLTNSGTVSSEHGNVNISAPTTININGASTSSSPTNVIGTISAPQGNINISTSTPEHGIINAPSINMEGGNYLTQNINVTSPSGSITGSVNQVTGSLNLAGDAAHITADTTNLVLGTNTINGDPTYVNTGGSVTINGAITATEDLTIIASGSILGSSGASLSTANSTGTSSVPSTDITLIAGASVSSSGTTTSTVPGAPIGSGAQAAVDFSSGSGGNITFSGSPSGAVINTSSTLAAGGANQVNGGNVTLVAYNGQISLPAGGASDTNSIDASSQNGNGGNVTIISAGASLSNINTSSNSPGTTGGNVGIYSQLPGAVSGTTLTLNSNGSLGGGVLTPTGPTINSTTNVGNISAISNNGSGGTNPTGSGAITINGYNLTAGNISGSNISLTGTTGINTGLLTGSQITLSSSQGNIGGSTALNVLSPRVTANAPLGSVSINDTASGTITLGGGSANFGYGVIFQFSAPNASILANSGSITAGTVTLLATGNGASFDLTNAINTYYGQGTINLTSDSDINNGNISGGLSANVINLTSNSGSIGNQSPLVINSRNFSANAAGSVYITDTASYVTVTVGASSANTASGILWISLPNSAVLANNGTLSANTVTLQSTGLNGRFILGAPVIGGSGAGGSNGVINLTAYGSIEYEDIYLYLNAPDINLTSLNGDVGSLGGGIIVTSGTFTANAPNGNVNISAQALSSVTTIGPSSANSATGTFVVATYGSLANSGTISANTVTLSVESSYSTLNLPAPVIGTNSGTINLSTQSTINNSNISGGLTANQINLNANGADIGNAGPLLISANSFSASGGNITVTDTASGNILLGESISYGGNLTLSFPNASQVTVSPYSFGASIGGQNVSISATAKGAAILILAGVGGTNSLTLLADGNINTGTGIQVGDYNVVLTSQNGNIGMPGAPLGVTNGYAGGNTVTANAPNGSVNIIDSAEFTVTIAASGANTTNGSFKLSAPVASSLATSGAINANIVSLAVTSSGASLNLQSPVIGTNNGTINLTSDANINNSNITGGLTAAQINLTSNSGSIGSSGPLSIYANGISANAPQGNVNISDTAAGIVAISSSSATTNNGTFNVVVPNATVLTNSGTISANTVTLQATGSGAYFNLTNPISGTSNGTINLASDSDINNSNFTGGLNAAQVNFTSNRGSIGNNGTLTISTAGISADAANGNVNITDNFTGTVTIGASNSNSTNGTFVFSAPNASLLTNSGAINANSVTISATATAGAMNFAAAVNGTNSGTISLTAGSNINNNNVTGILTANQISLTSSSGSIGNNGTLVVSAALVSASAVNGSINITDVASNAVTIGASTANTASGSFYFSAPSASVLSNSGAINANNITLSAKGSGASLNLSAPVVGDNRGIITIISDADINNSNLSGGLSASQINLTSNSGSIGNSGALILTADGISANAAGNVYIIDNTTDSVVIGASSAGANTGVFSVSAPNSSALLVRGVVSSQTVDLEATSSGAKIQITSSISGTNSGTVTLTADKDIQDFDSATVNASVVNVTSNNGAINLIISAGTVNANAANGSVQIADTLAGPITIGASSANSSTGNLFFDAPSATSMASSGEISANNVTLEVRGSGGYFQLNSPITASNGGTIFLESDANINNSNFTGGLNATQITLWSNNGSIGDTTTLSVNANTFSAQAPNGTVNVTDKASGAITIGPSRAEQAGTFTLTAPDASTVGNSSTISAHVVSIIATASGGSIDLTEGAAGTQTGGRVNLMADGDINVTNTALLADNVNLTSNNGNIGNQSLVLLTAPSVTANAPNGSVNITDSTASPITIGASGANTINGTFDFSAPSTSTLSNSGTISAHLVTLAATSSGASLNLAAGIDGKNGGPINLTSDASINNSNFAGGLNASQINLTSNSGSIGNSGTLTISAAGISANATNGSVNITDNASGTVTIGASTANASNGTFFLTVPNATSLANNGIISANTVTLMATGTAASFSLASAVDGTSSGTINLTSATNINNSNFTGGLNGAALNLRSNTGNVGNNGAFTTAFNNISVNAPNGSVNLIDNASGTVLVGASGANVNTGTFAFSAPNASILGNTGAINAQTISLLASNNIAANSAPLNAHDLSLTATAPTGSITLGNLSVSSNTSGNGGAIYLQANSYSFSGSSVTLSANATGSGSGGTVTVSGGSLLNIGSGILINATGGSASSSGGNGGTAMITASGTLSVDPAGIDIGPAGINGNGGTVKLTANGNLFLSSYLIANGNGSGSGGTIDLTSNSSTPFAIGTGSTVNGVNGFLGTVGQAGTNGTINVSNSGGGITDNALMYYFNSLSFNAGGAGSIAINSQLGQFSTSSITLSAPGGSLTEIAGNTGIFANTATVVAGNNIGTSAAGFALSAPTVNVNAGGQVSIADPRTTGVLLNSNNTSPSTGPFSFVALSGITTGGNIQSTGNVTLGATANNGNVVLSGFFSGNNVTLTASGTGGISARSAGDTVTGTTSIVLNAPGGFIGVANSPLN